MDPTALDDALAQLSLASQITDPADASAPRVLAEMPVMPTKHDFIVWVYLSEAQETVYRTFLESKKVAELLNTTRSPLAALNVLKKV